MKDYREFIINLLDDPQGVGEGGFEGIKQLCVEYNYTDILNKIQMSNSSFDEQDARYYLFEDDADDLRRNHL